MAFGAGSFSLLAEEAVVFCCSISVPKSPNVPNILLILAWL